MKEFWHLNTLETSIKKSALQFLSGLLHVFPSSIPSLNNAVRINSAQYSEFASLKNMALVILCALSAF
jgi:hypothetical protein